MVLNPLSVKQRSCLGLLILWLSIAGTGSSCQKISKSPASQHQQASSASPAVPNKILAPELTHEIKATRRWKIVYVHQGSDRPDDPHWLRLRQAAILAGEDFQVEIVTLRPEKPSTSENLQLQISLVADLIQKGDIDGIVIGPADSIALAPALEKAVDRQIAVVAIETPVNSDRLLTSVGFDNFNAARKLSEWVVVKLGGRGKVLILDGQLHHQNALERRRGFLEGLKSGDIDVLDSESGQWIEENARDITAKWLQQYPKIDAIIAANDSMAIGASEAAIAAKRQGILITGFDAVNPALVAIKEGKLAATVDQALDQQVRLAVQLIVRHLEQNETFPSTVTVPEITLITADNIDRYLASTQ